MPMHKVIAIVSLFVLRTPAAAQNVAHQSEPSLAALTRMRARLDSATKRQPFDFAAYQALGDSIRPVVSALIERDSLRTGADFLAASFLVFDPLGFFESRRVEHEMALAAMVLGTPGALQRVALTWDGLNLSMGLGQRIGSYSRNGVPTDMDPVPAPPVVRAVLKDLDSARRRAASSSDNAELQSLRDADQADRQDPIDQARMTRMQSEDPKRRARIVSRCVRAWRHRFALADLAQLRSHAVALRAPPATRDPIFRDQATAD